MTDFDQARKIEFQGKSYAVRHGSPFDRGSADSYYGRGTGPHKGGVGGGSGPRVTNLTADEIAEYNAGFEYNELNGDKKDWGSV